MKNTSKAEAFANVRDQIGFCGIWCGSCVVGNGTLRELTERYKEIISVYGLEAWGPKDFDYSEFLKGLTSVQSMPLCLGCLRGDGRENCEMRACALDKNISDCALCHGLVTCEHTHTLQKMRSGALKAGLLVKTEDIDCKELLEKWTRELKNKWPSRILFMND